MCGIAYLRHFSKNANNGVLELYKNQSHRGSEGFGCLFLDDKIRLGRSEDEKKMIDIVNNTKSKEILFHHRYPTSTPNFEEATHPIVVSNKELSHDYYVVHNGVITNTGVLYNKHQKLGYIYTTLIEQKYITKMNTYTDTMYNDSECLAIEIARFIEGKSDKIDASGSIAFIAIQVNKKTKKKVAMYYGRNGGNPLKSYRSSNRFILSSEFQGGVLIPENKLFRIDYATDKTTEEDVKIGNYTSPTYSYINKTKGLSDYETGKIGGVYSDFRYDDLDDLPISGKDTFNYTEEKYFELIEEESDLIGWLHTAKETGDIEEEMELEAELHLVREELKAYDLINF